MSNIIVSVVTVVRNAVDGIASTIESVLSQKNVSVQYIVIDGCSTDNTQDIIIQYADKIDTYRSENDLYIEVLILH